MLFSKGQRGKKIIHEEALYLCSSLSLSIYITGGWINILFHAALYDILKFKYAGKVYWIKFEKYRG